MNQYDVVEVMEVNQVNIILYTTYVLYSRAQTLSFHYQAW